MRVETKDGRRLVGILIPNENAEMIKDTILKHVHKLWEDMTDVTHEPRARERLDQLDAKHVDDCKMPSAQAAEGKQMAVDDLAVVAAKECPDHGDGTEDDSDLEDQCQQAKQSDKEVPVAKEVNVINETINATTSSAATGKETTSGERHETGVASCSTTKHHCLRDSLLSNS